jgi:hypothetical protein
MAAMKSIIITDPEDRSFPFSRELFEDPHVLYHGSWSAWVPRIDAEGFVHGEIPFDWQDVATVFRANQAVGRGSFLRVFLGENYPDELPARDLFLSADFHAGDDPSRISGDVVGNHTKLGTVK